MYEAYTTYEKSWNENDHLSLDEWRKQMEIVSPQFFYWSKTLDIEVLFLQFLKAQREANFLLYIETLVDYYYSYSQLIISIMLDGCQSNRIVHLWQEV